MSLTWHKRGAPIPTAEMARNHMDLAELGGECEEGGPYADEEGSNVK